VAKQVGASGINHSIALTNYCALFVNGNPRLQAVSFAEQLLLLSSCALGFSFPSWRFNHEVLPVLTEEFIIYCHIPKDV